MVTIMSGEGGALLTVIKFKTSLILILTTHYNRPINPIRAASPRLLYTAS